MTATAPTIVPRAQWGANPLQTPAGPIPLPSKELWLHHSAGEQFGEAGMRMLQSFTLHRPDEHYVDLEYSFVVDHADCRIFESRGVGRNSAATGGHNSISHAICVMGNFQNDPVSPQLIVTLANLVAWGYERDWWPLGFTGGHRDASGNSTACPGDHLEAVIPQINAMAGAIHLSGTPGTNPAPAPTPAPKPRAQEEPMLVRSNYPPVDNVWRGVYINVVEQNVATLGGASCNPNPTDFPGPWLPDGDVPNDVDGVRRFTLVDPTHPERHTTYRVS